VKEYVPERINFSAGSNPCGAATFHPRRRTSEETPMSEHVYKILELTGSSPTSIEDAVANAIAKAAKTVRRMQWFQVLETRGHIADSNVSHWQVTVKVGFTLD
jgi:dodecin